MYAIFIYKNTLYTCKGVQARKRQMSKQHFSPIIYIGDYLVTGLLSDKQYEQTKLSDDKSWAHRLLSAALQKIEEAKESALMQLEAEFDINEPLEDIPAEGEEGEGGEESSRGAAVNIASDAAGSLMSKLSTEQKIEYMSRQQEIENDSSNEEQQKIAEGKIVEDNIDKQIAMNDTVIQVLQATKQTYDDFLDQTDMQHC